MSLNTILGQKIKMEQAFSEGRRIPVTLIKAGPCVVTQIKTPEKDGYWGLQLGFGEKKMTKLTKPEKGHLRGLKIKKTAPRFLREVRFSSEPKDDQNKAIKVGDTFKVSQIFAKDDVVSVTGIGRGKGFAGVIKRWGFSGGPKTHGQGNKYRSPGSIGQGTTPGRVFKGKKMAGRMGGERVGVKGLKILEVDPKKNEIKVSGPVPGRAKGLLVIEKL